MRWATGRPDETHLRTAVERMGTNFVVFSDDVAWRRTHLGWAEPVLFMEHNVDDEDLPLMAS